jgi:alkyl hydroperoxide reductase subunit F
MSGEKEKNEVIYDLVIIGGGPAGVAGGVYAARKKLKTLFVTKDWGGQSLVSPDIQNWIGTISISGEELAKNLKSHLLFYGQETITVKEGNLVERVNKISNHFATKIETGEIFKSKTILITTGATRRKLTVKGAAEFENKGITYCATCDGPLFAGADVAVIGGGNAGFETAAQLSAYVRSVTLLQRSENYRADPVTVEKVLAKKNVTGITGTEILEIKGKQFVSSIIFKKTATGEIVDLPVTGIFVEIGLVPASGLVKDLVNLDQWGHIVVDPKTQRTSLTGIWAAGDVADGLYHQNNIAAGDAIKALEDIYLYLHAGRRDKA